MVPKTIIKRAAKAYSLDYIQIIKRRTMAESLADVVSFLWGDWIAVISN